jgi:hypothetical protein
MLLPTLLSQQQLASRVTLPLVAEQQQQQSWMKRWLAPRANTLLKFSQMKHMCCLLLTSAAATAAATDTAAAAAVETTCHHTHIQNPEKQQVGITKVVGSLPVAADAVTTAAP